VFPTGVGMNSDLGRFIPAPPDLGYDLMVIPPYSTLCKKIVDSLSGGAPMAKSRSSTRKITISLPTELVEFAEEQAASLKSTRSQVIGMTLARAKAAEEERLAAEGYRHYGKESTEFAEASAKAVAEAIDHAR
jgi:hypothetical protein